MNQNQCVVPTWDIDDDVGPTVQPLPVSKSLTSHTHSTTTTTPSAGHDLSMEGYEVAELGWENGQLTMHGLGLPRAPNKNNVGGTWVDKSCTRAGGTLESIVNQATHKVAFPLTSVGVCEYDDDQVPLLNPNTIHCNSTLVPISMAMEALVPNTNNREVGVSKGGMGCSTRVGSCSAAPPGMPGNSDWSVSASGSDRWQRVKRVADDTSEHLRSMTNNEMASTSFGGSLNTTTRTVTCDDRDHDSACHSRPQRDRVDEQNNQKKANSSAKRSRAAAVHNQSERKRRDKINQRMKTLQKLIPISNKTDKASMLDEVIEYLKQLQAQIQMLNTMRSPSMMMPLAIQQQQLLQMSMMAPMSMGMGLGMNMDQMNMSMNAMTSSNIPGIPTAVLNPAAYMSLAATTKGGDRVTQPTNMVPTDPLSFYLASQSHSITMDAYSKVAAMYQQLQQQQQQNPDAYSEITAMYQQLQQQQQIPNQVSGNNK